MRETVTLPRADADAQRLTGTVGHLINGTLVGDKLDFVLQLPPRKDGVVLRGEYVGTVVRGDREGEGKVVDGRTWNVADPSRVATWTGSGDAACAGSGC